MICWIASYPKSGNTWVRFLLINLLYGPQTGTSRFEQLIPDLHEGFDPSKLPARGRRFIKSHVMLDRRMPYFDRTERFVYIVRDPLDVLASNLNYFLLTTYHRLQSLAESQRQELAGRYIDAYLDHEGDPRWLVFGIGSWTANVESWTTNRFGLPGILVRYEDLIADTVAEAARIGEFLGVDATDADIERAVEASSFRRMRQIEDAEIRERRSGFFYKEHFRAAHRAGLRFMNRGKIGLASHSLTSAQRERAGRVFARWMQRLGYVRERGPRSGGPAF